MRNLMWIGIVFLTGFLFSCSSEPKYKNASLPVDDRIEDLLTRMTLEEKVEILSGDSTGFNGPGIERLGIPPIKMTDGPVGVRTGNSTAYPVSVNMAASWDTSLIRRYGEFLGAETRAKGKTVILGPCVGIHRFPLGGRNFESFGEDPFLSSGIAVSYVKGVQSQNVIATVKHYACNDQEWQRNDYDVIVDERSLREVHLAPFEAAVKEGGANAVMSSYNIINGQHASENHHLLNDVLKKDWGFKGIVMSDWVSVYSAVDAANNGLDLEMPSGVWFRDSLMAAVKAGKVSEDVINDKVRRQLWVRFVNGLFDNPLPVEDQKIIESDLHKNFALEMAQKSIILIDNKNNLLPLSKENVKNVAVIGPAANIAQTGGGGSSYVSPWHKVSPYEGLKELAGSNVNVILAEGISLDPFKAIPIPSEYLKTLDGKPGLKGEYFNNRNWEGEPALVRIDTVVNFGFSNLSPDAKINADYFSVRWTGKFIPPVTKKYKLAVSSDDGSFLYLNGKKVIDNGGNHGELQANCEIMLEGGKEYDIKIEFEEGGGDAAIRLLWKDPFTEDRDPTINDAVEAAKKADVAIVCVGNTNYNESEGVDVKSFEMGNGQDELVQAIAKVNPNTVVVVYGGVPVSMKNWLSKVKAVLFAGYPGQEGGTALAQILFGDVNPSAKLPFSYIQDKKQSPAFEGYQDKSLKVNYSEGVFVGYKYYEKNGIEPLFPFGYGLSYTTFAYNDLKIEKAGDNKFTATFSITNTGKRAGEEIAELYIGQENPSVPRPLKELKGFTKISLQPGETKSVTIHIDEKAFRYWHPDQNTWVTDAGTYHVSVGSSSKDILLRGRINL